MAKVARPPIPYKMYRHFAVVTVLITAAVAMLADGHNRGAVTRTIEERERETELQRISAEKTRPPQLIRSDDHVVGSFDESAESLSRFGKPTVRLATGHNDSAVLPGATREIGGARIAIPGYSQGYIDSLSEEEYRALVEQLRAEGMLSPDERRQRVASLERASRQRSGASGLAD